MGGDSNVMTASEDGSEERRLSRIQIPCDHSDENMGTPGSQNGESKCHNCVEILAKLSECEICMNPLQDSGVVACMRCGGFWCGGCSKQLERCPYCRAPPPKQVCRAFYRLLRDLNLPCRNQRWGCRVDVTSDTRKIHESICPYRQLICPVGECGSCLPKDAMVNHIANNHDVLAFRVDKVNVVIEKFGIKMIQTAMLLHKYKICLLAHGTAFFLKVSFFNYRIILTIHQKRLKYEVESDNKKVRPSFRALLEFKSDNLTTEKVVMLRDKGVNKDTLMSRDQYRSNAWQENDVILCITIHPVGR